MRGTLGDMDTDQSYMFSIFLLMLAALEFREDRQA